MNVCIYVYTSSARSGFARMKLENLNRASIGVGSARRQLGQARFKTNIPGPHGPSNLGPARFYRPRSSIYLMKNFGPSHLDLRFGPAKLKTLKSLKYLYTW